MLGKSLLVCTTTLVMICAACVPSGNTFSQSENSDIVAILDADPIPADWGKTVSIRFIVKEPVAAGYSLDQVVTASSSGHNISVSKGTLVRLDCMLGTGQGRWCVIDIIATPTPPTSE